MWLSAASATSGYESSAAAAAGPFFLCLVLTETPLIFALSAPPELSDHRPRQANTTSAADDSPDAGGGTNVSAATLPLSLLLMSDYGCSWQRG